MNWFYKLVTHAPFFAWAFRYTLLLGCDYVHHTCTCIVVTCMYNCTVQLNASWIHSTCTCTCLYSVQFRFVFFRNWEMPVLWLVLYYFVNLFRFCVILFCSLSTRTLQQSNAVQFTVCFLHKSCSSYSLRHPNCCIASYGLWTSSWQQLHRIQHSTSNNSSFVKSQKLQYHAFCDLKTTLCTIFSVVCIHE